MGIILNRQEFQGFKKEIKMFWGEEVKKSQGEWNSPLQKQSPPARTATREI